MSPPRGRCPSCGRSVVIRSFDGFLRSHGKRPGTESGLTSVPECPGSGKPPAPVEPVIEPRTHPRRTN